MPSDPAPNQTPPQGGKPRRRPNPPVGGNWIWLLVLCLVAMVIFTWGTGTRNTIYWSEFYNLLLEDNLKEVVQSGDRYEGEVKDRDKIKDEQLKKKIPTGKFSVERLQPDSEIQKLLNDKAAKGLV